MERERKGERREMEGMIEVETTEEMNEEEMARKKKGLERDFRDVKGRAGKSMLRAAYSQGGGMKERYF